MSRRTSKREGTVVDIEEERGVGFGKTPQTRVLIRCDDGSRAVIEGLDASLGQQVTVTITTQG